MQLPWNEIPMQRILLKFEGDSMMISCLDKSIYKYFARRLDEVLGLMQIVDSLFICR